MRTDLSTQPQTGGERFAPAYPPFLEFVALVALLMSLAAFSIDSILPAFGHIQQEFGVVDGNDLQLVVYAYMAGFGIMQLFFGPVADVVGRRPTLMAGLAIYVVGTGLALVADGFHMLLVARFVQGTGAAAARVLVVTLVRDRYSGREMARVMSLVMMLFITVPIIAPAVGSAILAASEWHMIVVAMFVMAVLIFTWFALRMPESLNPAYRKPAAVGPILVDVRRILSSRLSFGYASAIMLMQGCIMIYIGLAAQVFETDGYRLGPVGFPLVFGLLGVMQGVASYLNSRLVGRFGMRRMSHAALCGFCVTTGLLLVIALAAGGLPPLSVFVGLLAVSHFLFSLTMPNFNAMAMDELGDIAGTASSFIGFYSTVASAITGALISRTFDGTVIPLCGGYLGLGLGCLAVVLWAERGRLFNPHQAAPAK